MTHIKVVVNKGGLISDVLVSSEIADSVNIEVIDFCTDDPEEYDSAEDRMKYTNEMVKCGKLRSVW